MMWSQWQGGGVIPLSKRRVLWEVVIEDMQGRGTLMRDLPEPVGPDGRGSHDPDVKAGEASGSWTASASSTEDYWDRVVASCLHPSMKTH